VASFDKLGADAMVGLVNQLRGESSANRIVRAGPQVTGSMRVYCFAALEVVIDDVPLDLSLVRHAPCRCCGCSRCTPAGRCTARC
jgi:hypothetical protein